MLQKLKNKIFALSSHPHAENYFFVFCFIEAFMLPIPTTIMQAPMVLSTPSKSMRYTWIATTASVIGGIVGYCLGWLFFSLISDYVLHSSYAQEFLDIQQWILRWGILILFPLALLPIPFKITTISAGVVGIRFPAFLLIVFVGRFLHFFLIGFLTLHSQKRVSAWMLKRYGPTA